MPLSRERRRCLLRWSMLGGLIVFIALFCWLQSAAESGFGEAQYEFGRILIHGDQQRGIAKNGKKARQWWEKAADNGHGRAMEELAWRYTQAADGFPRDPARATALLEKIADGYRLGRYGLPQDQQMASSRLKRVEEINALEERAAQGDSEALVTIGRRTPKRPATDRTFG
ncbi:MAG: hypothetical protein KJP23_18290 [Deltaproteobacteria bacterium]|nr:hypothetical protein [Deltaproteobacteria bacterium]